MAAYPIAVDVTAVAWDRCCLAVSVGASAYSSVCWAIGTSQQQCTFEDSRKHVLLNAGLETLYEFWRAALLYVLAASLTLCTRSRCQESADTHTGVQLSLRLPYVPPRSYRRGVVVWAALMPSLLY